jgi:hypothetical protein
MVRKCEMMTLQFDSCVREDGYIFAPLQKWWQIVSNFLNKSLMRQGR